jgi:translation initiation factor eIF-2B subunit delta
MTYAYSHVVCSALLEAASLGHARFKVLVVDSRPEQEGKLMMQKLLEAGLSVSYVHINAISYAIREATKVFLGAAAIMHNGTVVSRAGTAAVAMLAHEHRKPVMVLCESYKFHERVQLDSITHNELGDPEVLSTVSGRPDVKVLAQTPSGASDADPPSLASSLTSSLKRPCLLNLKYDAMPAEYVTTIVCEFGMIPPTSVPVILRECNKVE